MGSIIGGVVGAAGSLVGGSKAKKSASQAADKQAAAQMAAAGQEQAWNKENAIWNREQNQAITGENQASMDKALMGNRANQTTDFGNLSWNQGADGQWSQNLSLDPQQQGMLTGLRDKQGEMINGMESGFGADNSVMQAMRALQQPELQRSRDNENARLAAMGLSTGSGSAWGNAQDTLNKADSTADLQAILAGQTAWNQSQQNMRSNLAGLNSTETGWKNNSQMPTYALGNAAQQAQFGAQAAPSTSSWAANQYNAGNAAGQATGEGWANASQGIGNLAQSAWGSYNSPTTVGGNSWGTSSAYDPNNSSYSPWSSNSYSLGSDPWGA